MLDTMFKSFLKSKEYKTFLRLQRRYIRELNANDRAILRAFTKGHDQNIKRKRKDVEVLKNVSAHQAHEIMVQIIRQAPKNPVALTLFRGTSAKRHEHESIPSYTLDANTAVHFAVQMKLTPRSGGKVDILEVMPHRLSMLYMEPLTQYSGEHEVLLAEGAKVVRHHDVALRYGMIV